MKIEGFEESMLTPIVDYLNGDVKLDRSFIFKNDRLHRQWLGASSNKFVGKLNILYLKTF